MFNNGAFLAYAKHTTNIEKIINTLVENAQQGNFKATIDTNEFLSESDWEYIRKEVQKRIWLKV